MAGNSSHLASFVVMFILLGFSNAATPHKDFLVGGKADAWKVPPQGGSDSLNKWAQKLRFQIGDHLVWKYDGGKDSVLVVTKEGYASCNTTNPIKHYNDGNTRVRLDHSGPYYFISGAKGHCEEGQKLIVVVLSRKGGRHLGASPAHSPAWAPVWPSKTTGTEAPAPGPSSGARTLEGGFVVVTLGMLAMWFF